MPSPPLLACEHGCAEAYHVERQTLPVHVSTQCDHMQPLPALFTDQGGCAETDQVLPQALVEHVVNPVEHVK
eukprot:6954475-Karenia_brevis.AAC.1